MLLMAALGIRHKLSQAEEWRLIVQTTQASLGPFIFRKVCCSSSFTILTELGYQTLVPLCQWLSL